MPLLMYDFLQSHNIIPWLIKLYENYVQYLIKTRSQISFEYQKTWIRETLLVVLMLYQTSAFSYFLIWLLQCKKWYVSSYIKLLTIIIIGKLDKTNLNTKFLMFSDNPYLLVMSLLRKRKALFIKKKNFIAARTPYKNFVVIGVC